MKQTEFTKDHTLITKGILVIMLLTHHAFYGDTVAMPKLFICSVPAGS